MQQHHSSTTRRRLRRALLLPLLAALARTASGSGDTQQVPVTPRGGQSELIRRSEAGRCVDVAEDCVARVGPLLTACGDMAVLQDCLFTCQACTYRTLVDEALACEDTHEQCRSWAQTGECEKNPRYMLQSCTSACGSCAEKQTGCTRANHTLPMAVPGGMEAMFARATTDFPELEVTALSTSPWVLQFENLISADEAQQMVAACKTFDRSMAGDQLSPVRTSTQCWCDDKEGCMQTDIVRKLTDKMLNVTMLPYPNAEYFQERHSGRSVGGDGGWGS
jgi:hypothetical protein